MQYALLYVQTKYTFMIHYCFSMMFDMMISRSQDFLVKQNSHLDYRFSDSSRFILFKATVRIMQIYVWCNIALN